MRIIAGKKRGMKLFSPSTNVSRPIIDRVKESLFSVLLKYDMPAGAVVADIFSGVGSLGLEALSRSAEFVTFVENDPAILKVLKKNIEKAGFIEQSTVVCADAFKVGAVQCTEAKTYDLVFVDPPYADSRNVEQGSPIYKLLTMLPGQLDPDAIVIVRTERDIELADNYAQLKIAERRCWGKMAVTIFRNEKK